MIDDDGRIHHDVVAALGQAVIAAVADTGLSAASIVRTVDTETTALVWASDERARALSELTATLGEGPGVTALREGTPVFATDLRQEPWAHRWVTFAREAQAAQVGSIIAVPLQIGVVRVGLLQLHGEGPATVAASLVAGILRPSDSLALALLTPQGTAPPLTPAELDGLDATRAVTHQAVGMASVQLVGSLAEALLALRARAFRENMTLSEVSRLVVARKIVLSAAGGAEQPEVDDRGGR